MKFTLPKKFQLIIVENAKKKRHTATKILPIMLPAVAPKSLPKVNWKDVCTKLPLSSPRAPAASEKLRLRKLRPSPVILARGPLPV